MTASEWMDISMPVAPGQTPLWPGSLPIQLDRVSDIDRGDPFTETTLSFSVHTGTHIDAPAHFIADGDTVERLDLQVLMGPCWVADLRRVMTISAHSLESAEIPEGIERLLLKTDNDKRKASTFDPSFIGLDKEAAAWAVEHHVRLLGIDYLSVQSYNESDSVHVTLLQAGIVILEGLDLSNIEPGMYTLICLPIRLEGTEGAPARALLKPLY